FIDSEIIRCYVYAVSASSGVGIDVENSSLGVSIFDCTVHGFVRGIFVHQTATTSNNAILNTVVYDCADCFTVVHDDATDHTGIQGCLAFDAGNICYIIERSAGDTFTVTGSIAYKNNAAPGTEDFNISIATTITYCLHTYAASTNTTSGAGCIDGEPTFCDHDNGYYGLRPDSLGWHGGDATNQFDIGPHWNILTLARDNTTLNGLNIVGSLNVFKGISHADERTGSTLTWCTISGLGGVAVDWFHSTGSLGTISYSSIHHNGCGIVQYGGNVIDYSTIYRNRYYGAYSDGALEVINHTILYRNYHGYYFDTNSTVTSFKNSITAQNSAYGIFSDTATVIVTYSDIADAYNVNIDATSETNLFIAPYFHSVIGGQEDFHLATVEGGFIFPEGENNPLIDAGESDMGAWVVIRVEVSNVWDTYTLPDNPVRVDFQRIPINLQERFDTSGVYRRNADAFQWNIMFTWPDDYDLDPDLPRIMEYLFQKDTEIRIYFAATAG
ncbi:hypothetical protein LCGC14_2501550, partial [marine sediment metagenome]